MPTKKLSDGSVHALPADMRRAISASKKASALWEDITPLARSEWVCWVTGAKKDETRLKRIPWMIDQMHEGQRRPCCWVGCPHRKKNS